jgi:hypothetical protein
MKKKWLIITAASLLAGFGALLLVLALLPARPGVTKENFDRIELGMTRTEVEAIFGNGSDKSFISDMQENQMWHTGRDDTALIRFSLNGRVTEKSWDITSDDRSLLQKIRELLPWNEGVSAPPGRRNGNRR